MATAPSRYFHTVSLRQRFIDELDLALHTERLGSDERRWLLGLTRTPVADDTDPVRVDRLTVDDICLQSLELSAALLLSHTLTDDRRVYLHTLARGIEVFSDRAALLSALRARSADGHANAIFEAQKIDGDPFKVQMLAIVEHQVARITHLTHEFRQTPSLEAASSASLGAQLHTIEAYKTLDPATHLLQQVTTASNDGGSVVTTQTLARAAFEDYCAVPLPEGQQRRFLDAKGTIASATEAAVFSKALADSKKDVATCYGDLLKTFWGAEWAENSTRRALAIERFGDSVRHQIYDRCHADNKSTQRLIGLLQQDTANNGYRMTLKVGSRVGCDLAGTFVVKSQTPGDGSLLWFTPDHQWLDFADLKALTEFLSTVEGHQKLRPALALQDQPMLEQTGQWQVELLAIATPLFAERVDSIIAVQARNLAYALGLTSTPQARVAMLDDALDIRRLLDPTQLRFNAGRWQAGAWFDFDDAWVKPRADVQQSARLPAAADPDPDADNAPTQLPSWQQQTKDFDLRAERLRRQGSTLRGCAEQALQRYLCVLVRDQVNATDIRVRWLESAAEDASDVETAATAVSESQRAVSMDLPSLLLECVSGHRSRTLPAGAQLVLASPSLAGQLQIEWVQRMLDKIAPRFPELYVSAFEQSMSVTQRWDNQQVLAEWEAQRLREGGMRLDLALAGRTHRFDDGVVNMAQQVLSRPVRALRTALAEPVTEAYTLSLVYAGNTAPLCDILVLRQPLGPQRPGLLWTTESGWRPFASLQALQTLLQRELGGPHRERWLERVGEADRRALRAHLVQPSGNSIQVVLNPVDGHAIQALQQTVLDHQKQNLRQLCVRARRCRFEAGLFTRLAAQAQVDASLCNMLDGLSVRVDNNLFEALLPPWLKSAPLLDLKRYCDLLARYYLVSDGGKDFLFDIPTQQGYAREQLLKQLAQDFPGQSLDPDQITVIARRYATAIPAVGQLPSAIPAATLIDRQSLTAFAINRFVNEPDAMLSVECEAHASIARVLTPAYLRQLVTRLDVGTGYVTLLRKALTAGDENYALRKRLFIEQLPLTLLTVALPEKIQGKLSAKAYQYVSRVLEMPDGIAREPVDGVRVILTPLQLVADAGMTPDPVTGVYMICPSAADAGPVVLLAIHHGPFTFREFASQAQLLAAIRSEEALQQLVLDRVEPEVHRRYAHGGFVEPHLPFSVEGFGNVPLRAPGPVTLGVTEIKGNALQSMFTGTVRLLLDEGISNAVTNSQADRAGTTFLATLGVEQVLNLLPSKLAALITLWQAQTWFRASAASASGRRWGEALSEFSAALAVMVSTREQAAEDQPGSELAVDQEGQAPAVFSWRDTPLTVEQRARLQALEARNVALEQMRHDKLLNLYFTQEDDIPYAVVAGKVYQVRRIPQSGDWTIVGADGAPGPGLTIDSNQHWQLDVNLRLRGGGGVVGKLAVSNVERSVANAMIIEASGMPDIRLLYRDRARRIVQAHLQARQYLQNSLDNLNLAQPGAPLDPRVMRIIGDFFGVQTPDRALLIRVEKSIKALFDAVTDPSLSPFSSPRFIVGSNRPGHEAVTAFVIKDDVQRRVFLSEQYFHPARYSLTPQAAAQGFESSIHHRAAILLHELSHQILDTEDIAYLEVMAPYPDLLAVDSAENLRTKTQVERLQEHRLSHRTKKASLFTTYEAGRLRDMKPNDDRGYNLILRITGAKNLDQARDVFLSDVSRRSLIMLNNADSLILLILRLGRHSFAPSP